MLNSRQPGSFTAAAPFSLIAAMNLSISAGAILLLATDFTIVLSSLCPLFVHLTAQPARRWSGGGAGLGYTGLRAVNNAAQSEAPRGLLPEAARHPQRSTGPSRTILMAPAFSAWN